MQQLRFRIVRLLAVGGKRNSNPARRRVRRHNPYDAPLDENRVVLTSSFRRGILDLLGGNLSQTSRLLSRCELAAASIGKGFGALHFFALRRKLHLLASILGECVAADYESNLHSKIRRGVADNP